MVKRNKKQIAKAPKNHKTETQIQSVSIRSAPIPTYQELQGYENIEKGLASRIVAMAERQQKNRQKIEMQESQTFQRNQEKLVNGAIVSKILGQIIGGIAVLSAIIGGIYLLSIGKSLEGYTSMIGAIGMLAVSLGLRNKDKGNKEKELNTATKIKNTANHGILILFRCGLFEFFTNTQDKASRNGASSITRIILEITAVSATSGLILPPAA